MNSLSWLIYWAGVCQSISGVFTAAAVFAGLASLFSVMHAFIEDEPKSLRFLKVSIPICFCSALLAVFTPSKDTLYAIAASEYGEEILKTPEASKARQALNAWLDKQIGAKAEPEKK